MITTNPEDLNAHYNELFRVGDIDSLLQLYEPGAVLYPSPGHQLTGHSQIRIQMNALLSLQGELSAIQLSCVQQDSLALLHANWTFKGKDAKGNPVEMGGISSKVARRGSDGTWRYVIDMPAAMKPLSPFSEE